MLVIAVIAVLLGCFVFLYFHFHHHEELISQRLANLPSLSDHIKEIATDPYRRIEAIKSYREETGLSLVDAKIAVDGFTKSLPSPARIPVRHWPARYWVVSVLAVTAIIFFVWIGVDEWRRNHFANALVDISFTMSLFSYIARPQLMADALTLPVSKFHRHVHEQSRGTRVSPVILAMYFTAMIAGTIGLVLRIVGIS